MLAFTKVHIKMNMKSNYYNTTEELVKPIQLFRSQLVNCCKQFKTFESSSLKSCSSVEFEVFVLHLSYKILRFLNDDFT